MLDRLAAWGWTREGSRWVHEQPKGTRIAFEKRDDGTLWLWLDLDGDKRVLGFEGNLEKVLDAIHVRQDEIGTDNYLMHYGELGEISSVSIIAWEQFEPPQKRPTKSWKK